MKSTMKCLAIIALAAIIGFSFAACGDGDGGDSNSATYTGYDGDGAEYKLVIEKGSGGNTGGGGGGGGGGSSGLNGTWVNEFGDTWVLNNGNFTVSENGVDIAKGTYSTSGKNITMAYTQIKGSAFGEYTEVLELSPNQWYTKQQLRTAIINYAVGQGMSQSEAAEIADETVEGIFITLTGQYSLLGNTLTITDSETGEVSTFTKQVGIGAFAVSLSSPDDRAAFRPQSGDNYKLTINGSSTSTGTVVSVSGSTIELEHNSGEVFSVTVSGKYITDFYPDIPLDGGGTYPNPGTLTPRKPGSTGGGGGGGSGKGGTFTLTGIPSEYNGWYMWVACVDSNGNDRAYGTMYDSGVPGEFALISNGRASIPLWTNDPDNEVGFQRYTGTGTFACDVYIHNVNNAYSSGLVYFLFHSVSFTNGNATKSWNEIDEFLSGGK